MKIEILTVLAVVGLCFAGCDQQIQMADPPKQNSPPPSQTLDVQADMYTFFEEANKPPEDPTEKIKALLVQAQQYLNASQFSEAMEAASNVLEMAPDNVEAQKIIDTAKARLLSMTAPRGGQ